MAAPKVLMVKFRAPEDPDVRGEKVRELVGEDTVEEIHQLFPEEPEDDLASVFEVVLGAATSVDEAKASLDLDEEVEYTHEPATRGPATRNPVRE